MTFIRILFDPCMYKRVYFQGEVTCRGDKGQWKRYQSFCAGVLMLLGGVIRVLTLGRYGFHGEHFYVIQHLAPKCVTTEKPNDN